MIQQELRVSVFRWVSITLGCVAAVLSIVLLVASFFTTRKSAAFYSSPQTLTNTWLIEWGGEQVEGTLPQNIKNGSCATVCLTTILENEISEDYLLFYTIQCNTGVWLDDEVLLEFVQNETTGLQFALPSLYYIIKLPKDYQGKTLHIEMKPVLPEGAGILPTIYSGDKASFICEIICKALPTIMLCIPLLFLSILLVFVGLFFCFKIRHLGIRMCYFGLLIITVCTWILLESRIKQLFFKNISLPVHLLAISYFLVPVFTLSFFTTYQIFSNNRYMRWLHLFSKFQFIIVLVFVLCGKPSSSMNYLMQVTSLATTIVILCTLFKYRKMPESLAEIKVLLYGLVVLCIGCLLELFRFFFFCKIQSGGPLLVSLNFFVWYYSFKTISGFLKDHVASVKENVELQIMMESNSIKMKVAQMHPHFLYNALSTIQTIVKVNPDYAYQLLQDFTIHLRGTVRSFSSDGLIPFSEELKNIKAYLNIEQVRFGDALKVEYDICCDSFNVVPLVIQPLVENAARHGIFERGEDGGTIIIRSYEQADGYVIEVNDTGMGFDVEAVLNSKINTESVGMRNLIYRLEKLLHAKVEINSVIGEGSGVVVWIPKGCKK